ncbi:hypothetical protein OG302_01345 [Streptomyces sp. NBC_01283]|uniref:HalD/BesD family halogenase n=1 Tax=Streptomyces sp. NBC_01283 TaxID=2903812 RepID=UPI00352F0175|nr:hypothetical protein OG302_01345 [Streptomyces sp. NBC_01283]
MISLPSYTEQARAHFVTHGYLPLPELLPPDSLSLLLAEMERVEKIATRRDFAMDCMNGSPRHMTTLGGRVIAEESPVVSALYRDPALLALLEPIAAFDVVGVDDPVERHVLNILHQPGDTHGAHIDDYPLALVLFLQAPDDPKDGGLLEYVPQTRTLKALDSPLALRLHHRPGDGYLLRSDTTAHRVTPLRRPGVRRTVLNFAYTTPGRQSAHTPSAPLLYE